MANCVIWNARPRNARKHITKNRAATPFRASSSSSIPLPTSYSWTSIPLLFRDPEGSASSSAPGAASGLSAEAQMPPWSSASLALALGSPLIRHHLHRQPGTPETALTSEEIADQILSAAVHRHRPQDPPSLRLKLLHGHGDLVPLLSTPGDAHTPDSRPQPTWACGTGSRALTAPTWSGQFPPAHGASPRDGSSVPNLIASVWSIAENKLAADHPTLPFSPPCAYRDQRS